MGLSNNIATLDALISAGRVSSDPEVRAALTRLASEVSNRLKTRSADAAAQSFFTSALRSLSRIKGSASSDIRLQGLLDCYIHFFVNGEPAFALAAAEAMKDLATRVANREFLARAYSSLGILHAEAHRIGDAVLQYASSIEIAESSNDEFSLVTGWINLGTALNYGSLYRDAIPCLERAISLSSTEITARLQASAWCNLAQSHFALGEYGLAHYAIQECFRVQTPPVGAPDMFNRTVREFTYIRIGVELQNKSAVFEHLESCIDWAWQSGSAKAEFLAELARGIVEVRFGDVTVGLSRLETASKSATTGVEIFRADALEALVRAYDLAQRPERALECLRLLIEAIQHSRTSGLRGLGSLGKLDVGTASSHRDLRELDLLEARLEAQLARREVRHTRIQMLERLAVAADMKEDISGQHGFRVGALARELGSALSWSSEQLIALELAGRLHDVGKTAVPDRILLTNAALEEAQRQFVSAHTKFGAELLSEGDAPGLRLAQQVALHHHEWWNGEGYPSRLAGQRIPIHARIVALADVFDALTHGRPFSPPWPTDKALAEIRARRGTQFDPELTDVFLNLIERLMAEHEDLDGYLGRESRHSPFLQARNKIRRMLEEHRDGERSTTVEGNQTRH